MTAKAGDAIEQKWALCNQIAVLILAKGLKAGYSIDALLRHVFFMGSAAMFLTMTQEMPDGPDEKGMDFMQTISDEIAAWEETMSADVATIKEKLQTAQGAKNGEQKPPAGEPGN